MSRRSLTILALALIVVLAIGCTAYYFTRTVYITVEFKSGVSDEDALKTVAKYGGNVFTVFNPDLSKPRVVEFSVSRIRGILIFKDIQRKPNVAWAAHSFDSQQWWGYEIFGFLGW